MRLAPRNRTGWPPAWIYRLYLWLMAAWALHGEFRVERGRMANSSKDGIMIDADGLKDEDLVGGVVRDIVGRGIRRDVVSLSGSDGHGRKIRNVLVDNVRGYDSALRGAVEVSDGTDNVTVRKVYAEASVYAVDVQDHKKPGQSNRHVVIEDVSALRCQHALRTANSRRGHANLTAREVDQAGILLETVGAQRGTLTDYLITGNLARVADRIQGLRGIVTNNLP